MAETKSDAAGRIAAVENNLLAEGFIVRDAWRTASLSERMSHHQTPGISVAVIDGHEIAWAKGYGVRRAGSPEPVTVQTLFQAGSISKPVAAVAALRLVEEGRIGLDEDVNRYLTSWKVPANDGWQPVITLRQLLSHTAGVTVHGFPGYAPGAEVPTLTQVLDGAPPANTDPVQVNTLPGVMHRYSGGGTSIVQQMLIDVVGKPFPELLRALVLDPLGMNDSAYEQPLSAARRTQAATAHPSRSEPIPGGAHTYPEMAAAGLWTTASDLARFAIEIQSSRQGKSNRVLSQRMVEEMLSPQIEPQVGLGVFFENQDKSPRFGHGGWDEGFVAKMTAFFDGGQGAVVMVNSNQGWPLLDEIIRAISVEYAWPDFQKERVTPQASPSAGEGLIGTFELRPGFALTLARTGDHLTLQAPGQPPLRLIPSCDTAFHATALDAEITLTPTSNSEANIVLKQSGREFSLKRTPVAGDGTI